MAWLLTTLLACGPTQKEVQALIDAELAAFRSELESANVLETEAEIKAAAAVQALKSEWVKSHEFLKRLDELMSNYQPTLPEHVDNTDLLRCTTDFELAIDSDLKKGARQLLKAKEKSESSRSKRQREFEQAKWIQYHLDYDWQSRVGTIELGACYDDYQNRREGYSRAECIRADWNWRVLRVKDDFGNRYRSKGEHLYSQSQEPAKPVLMQYLEKAKIVVPTRFSCKVSQVEEGKDEEVNVYCAGGEKESMIIVEGLYGDGKSAKEKRWKRKKKLSRLHKGDVISVPLRDEVQGPSGVLTKALHGKKSAQVIWTIRTAGDSFTIDEPASCPTRKDILGQ